MEWWETLTTTTVAGNVLWRWCVLFVVILLALAAGKMLGLFLNKSAERLKARGRPLLSVILVALSRPAVMFAFIVGLRIGLSFIVMPEGAETLAEDIVNVLIVLTIGFVAYRLVDVISFWLAAKASRTHSKMDDMLVPLVRSSLRITVVIMVLLQIATMLSGKELTSILAALGVGGLAVALAAQDTIKNFFGSLVLLTDKPFELGDRIVVDGFDGPVEAVGFRSTRIRTLEGHLITIPNGELANKTIQNIGKRPHIRRIMNITITYDTPSAKIDRALEILKDILKDHEGMHPEFPPRAFFNEFNDASLNLFAIYWYHPPDWWAYCAFTEWVNKEVFRRFNEEGIDFAFPTQTLYLAGDPKRPLNWGGRSDQ